MNKRADIVDAIRTPFGRYGGANVKPSEATIPEWGGSPAVPPLPKIDQNTRFIASRSAAE